jgi:hypothetical protein
VVVGDQESGGQDAGQAMPPLTRSVWAVIQRASGPDRKATSGATSSISPRRLPAARLFAPATDAPRVTCD